MFQTTFLSKDAGGAAWIRDILELLIENKINFEYCNYHGSWGLYPDFWVYPDSADINGTLTEKFILFLESDGKNPLGNEAMLLKSPKGFITQ